MESIPNPQNDKETIFDFYDRKVNKISDFEWNNLPFQAISPCEVVHEGLLHELEDLSKKEEYFYFIATRNFLIKYSIDVLTSDNKLSETPKEYLRIFFPIIKAIKNIEKNVYGFSLISKRRIHNFFNDTKSEIRTWFIKLKNICLLTTLHIDFELKNTIGSGNFSTVVHAINKNDKKGYAIKTIFLENIKNKISHIETIKNEIKILKILNHPNIIRLYDVYYSELSISLVFEYLKGGELFEYIEKRKSFTEEEAKKIIKKLLSTIKYLHDNNVIHRDLKPENILCENKDELLSFKIADFGLSVINRENEIQYIRCGSPGFVAPESLNKLGYNQKADIFSLGIIAYILIVGTPPFNYESFDEILRANKLCKIDYECLEFKNVSESALKFIKDTTEKDPQKRISAEAAEKHEWFSENNIQRQNSYLNRHLKTEMSKLE